MTTRFTGTELLLITIALEVVKSLIVLIGNKLNNIEGSDIEAMEQVLQSMKQTIELEKRIQEAQNAIEEENIDFDDWIGSSDSTE